MNIKPIIYENLTITQRIAASVEALARGDEAERQRLVKSCPKRTYRMNDAAYSGKMNALHDAAMAVECDMRASAINFFMHLYFEGKLSPDREKKMHQLIGEAPDHVLEIISIRRAWHGLLKEEGIDPEKMEKANEDLQHFAIKWMIFVAEDTGLEPDPESVEKYKSFLKNYLERAGE